MADSIQLSNCSYGKTGVRLVKVERNGASHEIRDLDVEIRFFGAFENAYIDGDNHSILPTDTMKNTVYVLARQQPLGEIEDFGSRVASHFLARNSHLTRVRIAICENIWKRITCHGRQHDSSFQMSGPESRTAVVDASPAKTSIYCGIKNLVVLKTSNSSFQDFMRDEYTTLEDTADRLFASSINAEWSCRDRAGDFKENWFYIRSILLSAFAAHDSRSVQHTLYAMGHAVLQQVGAIEEIRLAMPNRHCMTVDLSPFCLDNPNEVFIPLEEPSGWIEARLNRDACEPGELTCAAGIQAG